MQYLFVFIKVYGHCIQCFQEGTWLTDGCVYTVGGFKSSLRVEITISVAVVVAAIRILNLHRLSLVMFTFSGPWDCRPVFILIASGLVDMRGVSH